MSRMSSILRRLADPTAGLELAGAPGRRAPRATATGETPSDERGGRAASGDPGGARRARVVGPWRGEEHLERLAQGLRRELRLQGLLVTRSEEGMTLFDDAGAMHVGAQALEVFDVTGAGDTVIATLATLIAAGLSLREALPWANRAGGIVVGKFGTAAVSWQELST